MPNVRDSAWTMSGLKAAGFMGWVTFETLFSELETVPRTGGVYVVTQGVEAKPDFLPSNPGGGKPIGHWGGRLLWQLTRSAELLVAWRETPGMLPKDVETSMLADFRAAHGRPPFANDPNLLGR